MNRQKRKKHRGSGAAVRDTGYNICTKKGRIKRQILADPVRQIVEAAKPD
jgi:hypothetical protein